MYYVRYVRRCTTSGRRHGLSFYIRCPEPTEPTLAVLNVGTLRTRSHSTVPVHVKVVSLDNPVTASTAWKDLTMLLQARSLPQCTAASVAALTCGSVLQTACMTTCAPHALQSLPWPGPCVRVASACPLHAGLTAVALHGSPCSSATSATSASSCLSGAVCMPALPHGSCRACIMATHSVRYNFI